MTAKMERSTRFELVRIGWKPIMLAVTSASQNQNGPVSLNRTDSFPFSAERADHLRHNRKLSRYSFRLGQAGYDSGRATVQMGCNERLELSSRDSQSRGLPDSLKTP